MSLTQYMHLESWLTVWSTAQYISNECWVVGMSFEQYKQHECCFIVVCLWTACRRSAG